MPAGAPRSSPRSARFAGPRPAPGALALGRELAAYVLAADLVGYRDPSFMSWAASMRTYPTTGGPPNLIACHEERPNNWGTHCGASRIAIDLYIGDSGDLARAWAVFRGWVGDRSSYAGFDFGDLSWQSTAGAPVGVNPAGATLAGHNVDGVLPDDQRRSGGFSWPPACENYVWEALQGASLQAELLTRGGYPAWTQGSSALRRALTWLYSQANCPASGDDTWIVWLVNHETGSNFPVTNASGRGQEHGLHRLAGRADGGSAATVPSTSIRTSLPFLWVLLIVILAMTLPRRSIGRRRRLPACPWLPTPDRVRSPRRQRGCASTRRGPPTTPRPPGCRCPSNREPSTRPGPRSSRSPRRPRHLRSR